MAYADEKLARAVYLLASLPGGIHERLIHAYVHEISPIEAERDVPEYLRDDFNLLILRLTIGPTSQSPSVLGTHEERVRATVRAMSQDEAVEVARTILSLAHQFEHSLNEANGVNGADKAEPTDEARTRVSTRVSAMASTRKHIYSLHTFPFGTPDFHFNKK